MSRKAIAIFTLSAALAFGVATAEASGPANPGTAHTSLTQPKPETIAQQGTLADLNLHVIRSGVGALPNGSSTLSHHIEPVEPVIGRGDTGGSGTICDFCGHEGGVGHTN
jgi:hypothetical protein